MFLGPDEPLSGYGLGFSDDMLEAGVLLLDCLGKEGGISVASGTRIIISWKGRDD